LTPRYRAICVDTYLQYLTEEHTALGSPSKIGYLLSWDFLSLGLPA